MTQAASLRQIPSNAISLSGLSQPRLDAIAVQLPCSLRPGLEPMSTLETCQIYRRIQDGRSRITIPAMDMVAIVLARIERDGYQDSAILLKVNVPSREFFNLEQLSRFGRSLG